MNDEAVPRGLRTAAALSWRFLVVAAAVALLAWIVVRLRLVVLPVIVALVLATALEPAAARLRRLRVPNGLAALAVLLAALGLAVAAVASLVPPVVDEIRDSEVSAADVRAKVEGWLADLGLEEEQADRAIDRSVEEVQQNRGRIAAGVLTGAYLAVEVVAGAALSLFLLFFFLKDGPRLWEWVVRLFPQARRGDVREVGEVGWRTIGAYLRGTAIVALVDGVFIGLALLVLGVPLVLPLAVLTFLGGFLPIVGAFTAGIVAVLVALVSEGLLTALFVLAAIVAVQQLESHLLQPVGRSVALHPVAVVLAIAAGSLLWGVIGAFQAVPFTAVVARSASYLRTRPPRARAPARGEAR